MAGHQIQWCPATANTGKKINKQANKCIIAGHQIQKTVVSYNNKLINSQNNKLIPKPHKEAPSDRLQCHGPSMLGVELCGC
jgi:hypothetical protein